MKTGLITVFALALAGTAALADDPHAAGTTGQPSQSCSVTMVTPGNAVNAQATFNPTGTSQGVYANPTTQGGISSGNTHVVSQYDVACFQQTMRVLRGHGH